MYLIVGLGNPGNKYHNTRHNVGFDVLEALSKKLGVSVNRKKSGALIGECFIGGQKTILALPQTFMNLSGESVAALATWYKLAPEQIMVIYDDVDLMQGFIRIRKNGSAGTHNGMRSIVAELGSDQFPRLRVGVGKRPPEYDLADWVLSRYNTPEEKDIAKTAYDLAADAVVEYITGGIESAMCKYNTKKPKKEKAKPTDNPEGAAE